MKALIYILKATLKFIYSFLKLLPTNNKKVVFISRQSDDISLDFKVMADEITKLDKDYEIVFLCKKMNNKFIKNFNYML